MVDFLYIKDMIIYRDYDLGGRMVARTGGPKSENPRSEVLHIRLTLEEKENLGKYAAKHNLSKTQVVVNGIQNLLNEGTDDQ